MSTRIKIGKVIPEAYKAMIAFDSYMEHTQLTPIQRELIKMRASQINGCAYCLDAHSRDARKLGETEQRLYTLSAWRETSFFTEEEQAILALTEEVTLIHKQVSDATYNAAVSVLGEVRTAEVIMATIIINAWNRIGVSTHMQPALQK